MRPVELAIDVTSPEHPYVQLAGQLREAIANGETVADVDISTGAFPSLWAIVEDTRFPGDPGRRVSYNTVRRAVKILKDEGLVVAIPGRGTFVKRD